MSQTQKVDKQQIDYSAHAPSYDQSRFVGDANVYLEQLRRRTVHKLLGQADGTQRVLDVGCGTGRGLEYLASAGYRRVVGLDFTREMLAQAQTKVTGLGDYGLVRGDAFRLPFADSTFDAVMSLNFLHMFRLNLQQRILAEATRVCRPGGRLVIEFESIHKGLFVSRYLEQRRVKHRTKFNSLWEMRQLFPATQFDQVRVLGTELPKLHALFRHAPRLGQAVEAIAHVPPINWLAARVVVRAVKR
jgi:ubiquinone/menaquinone biosynthesis C-methylase UbiE